MVANERIFGHPSSNDTRFLHPIFYAIDHEKIDIIKSMIAKDHEILTIKNQAGLVPFFYAIYSDKKNVVKAMIEAIPEVLNQQNNFNYTSIFYAIDLDKKNAIKAMIEANPEVLGQQDKHGSSPFFSAIKFNKPKIEQEIVSSDCFSCFRIGRQPDTALNMIARAEIGRDLTDIERENLKEFAINFSLLKNFYYEKAQALKDRGDVKKILASSIPEVTSEQTDLYQDFTKIYQEITTNNIPKITHIKDGKLNSMHVFTSLFNDHISYFVFHVDDENKLTAISYCDGNRIDDLRKIEGSENHINGITTYQLQTPQPFSAKFVKDLLRPTYQKSADDFDKKIANNKAFPEGLIDYSKTTFSIPTKKQLRGNCTLKSPNILARFLLEQKSGEKIFDFDVDEKKTIGRGVEVYKEFKQKMAEKVTQKVIDAGAKIDKNIYDKLRVSSIFRDIVESISKKEETTGTQISEKLLQKIKETFGLGRGQSVSTASADLVFVHGSREI
jgi:ankyrin repeat protein